MAKEVEDLDETSRARRGSADAKLSLGVQGHSRSVPKGVICTAHGEARNRGKTIINRKV